ncbi:MAG TPA: hypothetical protein VGK73_39805 [Polyangiaceae bacterium]
MTADALVAVSPRHGVRLAEELLGIVQKPQRRDFVVRTLAKRMANGLPLMSAEIVIAGAETRAEFPLSAQYPLHFRKTYFPGRLRGDPKDEFARQSEASELIGLPPPIGYGESVFRACLVPGKPYAALTPFNAEPEERNLRPARELPLAAAAGQFRLVQDAYALLLRLHEGGLVHGDAVLQNFIVSPSPLEILPIDFEASQRREAFDETGWQAACEADVDPLLREAVLLQCSLGPQPGPLAEHAARRIQKLFRSPERFLAAIESQADLGA